MTTVTFLLSVCAVLMLVVGVFRWTHEGAVVALPFADMGSCRICSHFVDPQAQELNPRIFLDSAILGAVVNILPNACVVLTHARQERPISRWPKLTRVE